MREDRRRNGSGLIQFSKAANADRKQIFFQTSQRHGAAQARRYSALLKSELEATAAAPDMWPFAPSLNRVRFYMVRQKGARDGHRIFYREIEGGIFVLRILHTAANWPDHITAREV